MPEYKCLLCDTQADPQKSHHVKHCKTKKHKDKKRIKELELNAMTSEQRVEKYKKDNVNEIINELETHIIDNEIIEIETNVFNITNSDSLKEHIHSIHNYLRNHGGGYGLGALKIFNIFYGIKKLEEHGLNEVIGLSEEYTFSSLLKKSKEMTDEEFHHHIVDGLLNELYEKPLLNGFIFYEIPKNIKSDVFRYLIGEINDITSIEKESNVLLSGKVYEYFVGRDESAISELGAYFTNRILVDFTIGKVNPQLDEDGNVPSMIDMFGGSGGFTTGYVNYMKEQYPDIDWTTNVHNIFHYDINEDVLKAAALEIFCLTGQLPNMENIAYKHSFKTEFAERPKYILTNPPYGGDKNTKSQAQLKRDILKKYILSSPELKERHSEQLKFILNEERKEKKVKDKNKVSLETCSELIIDYAKIHGLTGNDKESCSLILLMAMLAVGGTCAGVLKEGVMFDKKYKALRKCLIENFNVREVVSIPADQFENTTTKTSLVIFDNTEEKTSEIKFSKLDVVKYTENKIEEKNGCLVLTEMAEDISGCQEVAVSTATIQDVQQNPIYSLNGKDYNQPEIVCGEDYEMVEMKDLCEFKSKSKRKASFGKQNGQFNFYTSSNKIQKCDVADYEEECLIIGDGGIANIQLDSNFSCSDHNHIVKCNNNIYVYYILCGNIKLLSDGFTGSVLKNLSKEYLKNLKIPVPKNPDKIQHWVDKISQPYNEKNEKQIRIQELEKTIQERIQSICDNEDCEEKELGEICSLIDGYDFYKKDLDKTYDEGKNLPVIKNGNSTITYADILKKYEKYLSNKNDILICTMGTICIKINIFDRAYHGHHIYRVEIKNNLNQQYLYYYINKIINKIKNLSNGSVVKGISKSNLSKIKIKLPKNKKLIDDLNPMFQEIEEHQQAVKDADELYKKYIQELSNEAIPKP